MDLQLRVESLGAHEALREELNGLGRGKRPLGRQLVRPHGAARRREALLGDVGASRRGDFGKLLVQDPPLDSRRDRAPAAWQPTGWLRIRDVEERQLLTQPLGLPPAAQVLAFLVVRATRRDLDDPIGNSRGREPLLGGEPLQTPRVQDDLHESRRPVESAPQPVVRAPGALVERAEVMKLEARQLVRRRGLCRRTSWSLALKLQATDWSIPAEASLPAARWRDMQREERPGPLPQHGSSAARRGRSARASFTVSLTSGQRRSNIRGSAAAASPAGCGRARERGWACRNGRRPVCCHSAATSVTVPAANACAWERQKSLCSPLLEPLRRFASCSCSSPRSRWSSGRNDSGSVTRSASRSKCEDDIERGKRVL